VQHFHAPSLQVFISIYLRHKTGYLNQDCSAIDLCSMWIFHADFRLGSSKRLEELVYIIIYYHQRRQSFPHFPSSTFHVPFTQIMDINSLESQHYPCFNLESYDLAETAQWFG